MSSRNVESETGLDHAIVKRFRYSNDGLHDMVRMQGSDAPFHRHRKLLTLFPTVYVIRANKGVQSHVYVGETNNIVNRTRQHLEGDAATVDKWKHLKSADDAAIYLIGSDYFNKSLTLDVENKLILYLSSVPTLTPMNIRGNSQNNYYTREHLEPVFNRIWAKLHADDPVTFPAHEDIKNSAIFKASPFHKLTPEQYEAKERILTEVIDRLADTDGGHLILVEGAAGTGKTVLLSSLFLSLFNLMDAEERPRNLNVLLAVNQDEHVNVFQDIARRLGLQLFDANGRQATGDDLLPVMKPTRLIKRYDEGDDIDVILVDEAHLLYTQGKQAYRGKNQLLDLLRRAKIVIAIYDPAQALATHSYWERHPIELTQGAHSASKITLKDQVRIKASDSTQRWIRNFIDKGVIERMPSDSTGYDLRVFESAIELREAVLEKARQDDSRMSRITATYDWPFKLNARPEDGEFWMVELDDGFAMPWNLQMVRSGRKVRRSAIEQRLAWVEDPLSLHEVGSTFTMQGFDLHYAGVIIGPSVIFRDGKVQFDSSKSFSRGATNRRTLSTGSRVEVSEELLRNELNVLLTRGVNGLYIYAVDEDLQQELLRASGRT